MAYVLREYKCLVCGSTWEALEQPTVCAFQGTCPSEGGATIVRVIGKPASYKHSSWESWRKR